jgi:glycosyltransferase involved in cell wall biosynthesis
MRIALSVETFLPKIDGISAITCLTLEHLQHHNISAMLLAPKQGTGEYASAQVIGVPCVTNPFYPEGKISFPTPYLYRAISDFRPDLVHAIDPGFIGAGALISAKLLQIPTVASYHLSLSRAAKDYGLGILEKPIRKLRIWEFNAVDHALAPSRSAQTHLHVHGVRRVGFWRRGVDSQRFHPRFKNSDMRTYLSDGHPQDVLLLYVGRLAPEKRLHLLRPVLEQNPNVRLALVGDGPSRASLEALFMGMPVNFTGYLRGEDLAAAYASADVFVFTSAHESFGLVLAEAIASGLPVISSRVGGAEDIILHGETGYVFDVEDITCLEEYVHILATDNEKRHTMGRRARRFAETLDWGEIMRDLIYFYEDILREKGRITDFSPSNRPRSSMLEPRPVR